MKRDRKCTECGSSDICMTVVPAGGGQRWWYAPDLLPGAHPWWKSGRLEVYVCLSCGYFQYFVPPDALQKVRKSKKFMQLG